MSVQAKFRLVSIKKGIWQSGPPVVPTAYLELAPVTGDTPENKAFFQATPGGKIELNCVNAAAADQFELGGEYYVTFERANG